MVIPLFCRCWSYSSLSFSHHRQSWHYNCVGPLESMEGVVNLTKMQLVNFLRVWNYFCMKTSPPGILFLQLLTSFIFRDLFLIFSCRKLTYSLSFCHLFGQSIGILTESSLSSGSSASRKSSQSRLLCFVVTAIAKLATHHRDLLPRARVSLAKVSLVILNPLTQKKCWIWSLLKNHRINNDCKLLIQTERKMIANEETLWLCSVA